MAVEFDPFHPDVRKNPYPHYRAIREADPVHHSSLGYWFVSTYAEADAVLRDRRFGRDFRQFLDLQMGSGPLRNLFDAFLFFMDPPDHTRLRMLVTGAFTPATVRRLRSRIELTASRLIDRIGNARRMDIIEDLAAPLPVQVICELLGLPDHVREHAPAWSRDLSAALEFVLTPEVVERGNTAAIEAGAYLQELIKKRRAHPEEGLFDRLIAMEIDGQRLTDQEIIGTSIFLFGAGHETTTCLIGNAVLALVQHCEQLQKLKGNPTLAARAIDEFLRYDAPVQMTGRIAREDVVVGEHTVPAGSVVAVILGAANRDPARFANPDTLDLERTDNTSLSFGGGVHYCLGSMLARTETEIAITTLLKRLPTFQLESPDVSWRDTLVLRGASALPIVW